ncbi:MAG: lysozyme inhibitor LprI family protein [Pseudomonadota bacterium]|nr:lysozyme inhibitor LprI family protein [Pseudomonadota bacterium]
MKKRWIGLLAWLVLGQAQAASFDCGKAGTKVEKLICADQQLSEMDNHLAEQYALALGQAKDKVAIKAEQIAWLKERNGCPDRECVRQHYYRRLDALATRVAGGPARFIDSARMFEMAKKSPVTLTLPGGGSITIESGGKPPEAVPPLTSAEQSREPLRVASFDCGKAKAQVEKIVCADPVLSDLDGKLAALYAYERGLGDIANLKAEQKAWLRERNRCRDAACINTAYEKQITRLTPAPAAAPAPPANLAPATTPVPESSPPVPMPTPVRPAAQPPKPFPKLPELPVRSFTREADKAAAINKILAGHTLHYSTPEGKEPPFCSRLQVALRAGQGVGFVEPEFTTQDVNDPRLARYRRCAIKEEEISSDFKIKYSPADMLGNGAFLANLKLFRFDADNNPANGLEEFLYGESTSNPEHFLKLEHYLSRKVMTGYSQMDFKRCKHLDGAPADWSSPLADGLSAIIRFENRYYILSMSIYETGNAHIQIWNLRPNKKHKWDAYACLWSTFPYLK